MTAAAFVLAINLAVAAIFATAFGVIAAYQRSALGARWLGLAYGLGAINPLLEFAMPYQQDHRMVSLGIFVMFLLALAGCVVGLARHYRVEPPWLVLGAALFGSVVLNIAILDMPHENTLRAILYQAPYTVMQAIGLSVALRAPRKGALDYALMVLLAVSGLHFLAKPLMAAFIGDAATPQAYMNSAYAAYSQSLGAILLITNGLLMLLIIARDVLADMTSRSETDGLSELLNRRGFEVRGSSVLAASARSGVPAVLVVADLDHFKQINDRFGHAAGDEVIRLFARTLSESVGRRAIIGRLGGEEFAVLLSDANLAAGRLYAEAVRSSFRSATHLPHPVSASFGVAQLSAEDTLSDLMLHADAALYQAKAQGRDRVSVAPAKLVPIASELPPAGLSKA